MISNRSGEKHERGEGVTGNLPGAGVTWSMLWNLPARKWEEGQFVQKEEGYKPAWVLWYDDNWTVELFGS